MIALIPARSGSKRVPNKNVRLLGGYPLMAWSIACANMVDATPCVSTDSLRYINLAKQYRAETILRGEKASDDHAKDIDVIEDFESKYIGYDILFLRPTTPLRDPKTIYDTLISYDHWGHWISVCKMRDGDFYRNTGCFELIPYGGYGMDKKLVVLAQEVGEIDEEDDFDYIEWRLAKYGSPIHNYLRSNFPDAPQI